MVVFRIERQRHLSTTLSGIGASMADGFRWNSMFTRMVYTAETRALAMLEVFVHLDLSEDLPSDRYFVEIDIPDSIRIDEIAINELPKNWDAKPPGQATQRIGDQFVRQNRTAVLKVPSSIVPGEFNYLINPTHADSQLIKITKKYKMAFDQRLKNLS